MKYLYYALTHGKSFVSKSIEFWTRSSLSHALFVNDVLFDKQKYEEPGVFIEMWKKPKENFLQLRCIKSSALYHSPGTKFDFYRLKVNDDVYDKVHEFQRICAYLEIPYDWKAIVGFVIPFKLKKDGHLFCSEKECLSLKYAGIVPKDYPCWKCSPDRFKDLLELIGAEMFDSFTI